MSRAGLADLAAAVRRAPPKGKGPPWFAPSADLTVHLLEPLRTEWLLAHDRARWADDGWTGPASASTRTGAGNRGKKMVMVDDKRQRRAHPSPG